MNIETTIYIETATGEEISLTAVGRYSGGSAGRFYGEPEDCYPGDSEEVEVVALLDQDSQPYHFTCQVAELAAHGLAEEALTCAGREACEDE